MTTLEKLQYLLDRRKITIEQIAPEYREQLKTAENDEEEAVSLLAAL